MKTITLAMLADTQSLRSAIDLCSVACSYEIISGEETPAYFGWSRLRDYLMELESKRKIVSSIESTLKHQSF